MFHSKINKLITILGVFIFIYILSSFILYMIDLQYRMWITVIVLSITVVFIILLLYVFVRKILIINKALGKGCCILAVIIGSLICLYIFTFGSLYLQQEIIVEKDGQKMIAIFDGSLDVKVNYYSYKNFFVRGNKILISEYFDGDI